VLRSALRQDPDIILVGEMRDQETAQIGLRAALTGHLVLSTLHTKDAASTPIRLIDMGAPYYMVGTSIHAVLAQRLVRVFCTSCKGKGCAQCRGTGYRGRKAIGELLVLTDEMRELIIARAPARKLKEVARAAGTLPLREAAMRLVNNAETSIEEINRVTFVA
jgi:type II secretory ATPase GspE/PulE/Tfp pilus assembly ATPase PilB-like protein